EEAGVLRHLRRGGVVRAVAQLEPMDAEAIVQMVHEAPQGRRCQSGAPCGGDDPVGGPRARVPTFDPGGHNIADDAPLWLGDEDGGVIAPPRSQDGVPPPTLPTRAPPYPCSADAPQTE